MLLAVSIFINMKDEKLSGRIGKVKQFEDKLNHRDFDPIVVSDSA